jgi:hypothetical protein
VRTVLRIGLVVVLLAVLVVFTARWLDVSAEQQAESLFKRAAQSWGLDSTSYRSIGIRSNVGGVVVRTWQSEHPAQTDGVDVTAAEGLVCRWRRLSVSNELQNLGCLQLQ